MKCFAAFACFLPSLAFAQFPMPDDFNPGTTLNAEVRSAIPEPDGSIFVAGGFQMVAGANKSNLAKLTAAGLLNLEFNALPDNDVFALCVQPDGKIILGGQFQQVGGIARTNLARLNPDGTFDSGFVADLNFGNFVTCLALQTNGQILVGGRFNSIGGIARTNLARLNPDGSLDPAFDPNPNRIPTFGDVTSVCLQSDGKILVGGSFAVIDGQARPYLARLFPDGTIDSSFNPLTDGIAYALATQTDGKILVGGNFTVIGGVAQARLARLNLDGTADTNFTPTANNTVHVFAQQADGRILVGGAFSDLCGQPRKQIGRLNANGSLDETFTAQVANYVSSLAVQSDGKILVGGSFTNLGGLARTNIGRLNATETATQTLNIAGETLNWMRGGTSPEIWRATFEYTSNGIIWTSLGEGVRVSGGWELANVSVGNGVIRARGYVTGGAHNGSAWFVEALLPLGPQTLPSILVDSGNFGVASNRFSFDISGSPGQIIVVETSTNLVDWHPLGTNALLFAPFHFSDDRPAGSQSFYRTRLWP